MRALELKINKLENEKSKKVERKNQLEEEIGAINSQLKELKSLYSQFEKLEKEKERLLGTHKKQSEKPKKEEPEQLDFSNMFEQENSN